MKKLLFLIQLTAVVILFSPMSYADDDDWGHHGHGWGHHHGHHHDDYYYPQPQINYYPQPQVNYYPAPQINYYPQPQVNYYQRQAQYSADPRSHQGLAGGVIGSVFGYELGSGDPIATGLGAAAGSFLGNGMSDGYQR
ncbi:MAG: glycine zipper 2TM domain-containing protein [Methylobacter tundripaludum]|uniref:Glycine zipper 2TM protein n=1 Tax=Methylobacter tundripaludum TaxID=173365 RepID=A0A2S6HD02_9GAMM|nr:glycine zipper 2TM domain-containing protein [Methylobacter tundripaludum]MDD4905225.1 glycine zipper 2TM domain-containing protein [Methylobacter tundripaludum]PPK75374.1 glycine zipper 2TM protein [Methylobacter tundripaludum]